MKLRRGENFSLPWCMAVHMFRIFFNSEFNKQNLVNSHKYTEIQLPSFRHLHLHFQRHESPHAEEVKN